MPRAREELNHAKSNLAPCCLVSQVRWRFSCLLAFLSLTVLSVGGVQVTH